MAGNNCTENSSRSIEKLEELANIAGISKRKGLIQTIVYSKDWMKEDYKLLELNDELLKSLHQGDEILIRGNKDDDTVLCSKDKTYELRAADTSNTLLLFPEISSPASENFCDEISVVSREVQCCFSTYYEARLIQPKLDRLRNILDKSAYSNSSNEDHIEKYTMNELLELIQASGEEIENGLKSLGALAINGYWRVIDINYREKAFSQILALIEEKSWDWHYIPLKLTCDILEELYPSFVLEYCLKRYGKEVGLPEVGNEMIKDTCFCLDEEKVCRYYAEYILRPALGKFNYNEFLEAWEQSVPDGMKINEDYLLGLALTDLTHYPPVIWHFPESNLPETPRDRFNILFKTRTKWLEKDLVPYMKNLLAPGQKLSSLFLKYTRCSTNVNGDKIYNSKHPF